MNNLSNIIFTDDCVWEILVDLICYIQSFLFELQKKKVKWL